MSHHATDEAAFETVLEAHLLASGYAVVGGDGFGRARAIFPGAVLDFIRETQPKEWSRLAALHGSKTSEQILGDLCKWMDQNEEIFIRLMNDPAFQKIVTTWMASQAYERLRKKDASVSPDPAEEDSTVAEGCHT